METKRELKILAWIILVFAAVFFLPLGSERFMTAIDATLDLARWYAREHVILCLLPAFFIAGVIAVFVSQGSVIKYFGANAKKWLSYSVAAISGGILAVCSCTILPLFTSIYKRGAGLGPAIAFLYSGPAISILSIILTARILGIELGIARTLGAILFSVVIGLLMSFLFRREERAKREEQMNITPSPEKRPMWQTSFHFFTLVLILVFANWGAPAASDRGLWAAIFAWKWYITGALSLVLCWSLVKILRLRLRWVALGAAATVVSVVLANLFIRDAKLVPLVPMVVAIAALSLILLFDKRDAENREWALSAWGFAKQILPLLAVGVVTAGFLLGSTHDQTSVAGIIPNRWIEWAVGGNSLLSNFFASFTGAFMYFATLTEVPIIQGLLASGMGKGPALALLLAGPSLSLPNMLVIRGVLGTKKTVVYVALVGNSCRSQMAHGFLQAMDSSLEVFSGGTQPAARVNARAVEVMREAGIDIASHIPTHVNVYLDQEWDYVITVCGGANESCPAFTGKVGRRLHMGFDDPSHAEGSPEFIDSEFRRVRDEIRAAFARFYRSEIQKEKFHEHTP